MLVYGYLGLGIGTFEHVFLKFRIAMGRMCIRRVCSDQDRRH